MAKNEEQVNFRMPGELRQKLKDAADKNNRSLTAELVARLEESFNAPERAAALEESVAALKAELDTVKEERAAIIQWMHAVEERLSKK